MRAVAFVQPRLGVCGIAAAEVEPHLVPRSQTEEVAHLETDFRAAEDSDRLRIERAKILLTQGRDGMEQVARSVGYANIQSFARFFKKYEGMTPGKFRALSGPAP